MLVLGVNMSCAYLFLAVELVCGNVYCWKCRDYIYDWRIDGVMKEVEQTLKGRQVSGA